MSCLYSSPEVNSLEINSLGYQPLKLRTFDCRRHRRSAPVHILRTWSPRRLIPHRFCRISRSTKTRSPSSAHIAGCIKSFRLPTQAQASSVSFRAQYQAFVRFAVGSGAALSAIALK
jgi:hypothetical protein